MIPTSMYWPPMVWWQWTAMRVFARFERGAACGVHRQFDEVGRVAFCGGGQDAVDVDLDILIVEAEERQFGWEVGAECDFTSEPDVVGGPGSMRAADALPEGSRSGLSTLWR